MKNRNLAVISLLSEDHLTGWLVIMDKSHIKGFIQETHIFYGFYFIK